MKQLIKNLYLSIFFLSIGLISGYAQTIQSEISGEVVSRDSVGPTEVQSLFLSIDYTDQNWKVLSVVPVPPPVEDGGGIPTWIWIIPGAGATGLITYLLIQDDEGTTPSDDPVANGDQITVPCNGSGNINALQNDSGSNIQITDVSSVTGVEISFTNSVITVENVGLNSFSFNYTITDDQNRTSTATVSVTVNTPEITAFDDEFSFESGGTVSGNILTNDTGSSLVVSDYGTATNGDLSISMSGEMIYTPNEGFCGQEIIPYTITDACDQQSSAQIVITGNDMEAPAITCPADVVVSCQDSLEPAQTGEANATDDCSPMDQVTIVYEDDSSGLNNCNNTGTLLRTWTATDAAGNASTCTQTIQVEDTVAPSLQCPPDIQLDCGSEYDVSVTGMATAEDACGEINLSYEDDLSGLSGCNNTGIVVRSWTAEDGCGNVTNCTQTIEILMDAEAPTLNCVSDISIQCGDSIDPAITGTPTAEDGCGDVVINYEDDLSGLNGCNNTGEIIRSWTAEDGCGNVSTCTQSIVIPEDIETPELSCVSDITIGCGDSTDPAVTGTPTAEDGCGDVVITFEDDLSGLTGCSNTGEIIRSWTAEDGCGNVSTCTQSILIPEDTEAPVTIIPADVVISCGDSTDPDNTGIVQVSDNCSSDNDISVIYEDSDIDPAVCDPEIIRTWTVTDVCGNSTTGDQIITIQDNASPVITCPANITITCDSDSDPETTGNPIIEDDCGVENLTVTYEDVFVPDGSCAGTITRTWTAVDPCGNTSACEQTITIEQLDCDFTFTLMTMNADCGLSNGVAFVEITPGSDADGPFSITWTNGETGTAVNNLSAGNYQVFITDLDIGCTQNQSFTIGENPPNMIAGVEIIPNGCDGTGGNIIIDIQSPGTGPMDILIGLPGGGTTQVPNYPNNQLFFLSEWVSNPPGGTYTFIIVDQSAGPDCAQAFSVNLPQGATPMIEVTGITPASGPSANDGQIFIAIDPPGVPPYTVYINEMPIGTVNTESFVINGVPSGEYSIFIIDNTGCMSNTVFVFMPFEEGVQLGAGMSPELRESDTKVEVLNAVEKPFETLDAALSPLMIPVHFELSYPVTDHLSFFLSTNYHQGNWIAAHEQLALHGKYEMAELNPYLQWNFQPEKSTNLYIDLGYRYSINTFSMPYDANFPNLSISSYSAQNWFARSGLSFSVNSQSNVHFETELLRYNHRWFSSGALRLKYRLQKPRTPPIPTGIDVLHFK